MENFETIKPRNTRVVSIGSAQKDTELIAAILHYQKQNKLASAADAVRDLCKYALEVKKI